MKTLKMINGLNFKAVLASCLVLGIFGVEVSHAGDSTNTASTRNQSQVQSASRLTKKAKELSKKGEDRAVLYIVSEIVDSNIDPKDLSEALFLQGKSYSNLGKYRKAIASYSEVISICEPGIKKSLAYSYRADIYEKIGEFDQALIDRESISKSM